LSVSFRRIVLSQFSPVVIMSAATVSLPTEYLGFHNLTKE